MNLEERHEGETCSVCERRYLTVYRVPDAIWHLISDREDGSGLLCSECCEAAARGRGITLFWEATPGDFPAGSGLDHLNAALSGLVEHVKSQKAALEQAEAALRRLASQESFIIAFDAEHAPADVIWRELQARGKYAVEALAVLEARLHRRAEPGRRDHRPVGQAGEPATTRDWMSGRDCPYCAGAGCEECDQTGRRYRETWVTDTGVTLSVSGAGDGLKPELREAFEELAEAAQVHLTRTDPFEGAEADRPEDLPVPANADRRFDEMDGG